MVSQWSTRGGEGAIKLGRRAQSCEQPKQRSKSKGSLKCTARVHSGKDGMKKKCLLPSMVFAQSCSKFRCGSGPHLTPIYGGDQRVP